MILLVDLNLGCKIYMLNYTPLIEVMLEIVSGLSRFNCRTEGLWKIGLSCDCWLIEGVEVDEIVGFCGVTGSIRLPSRGREPSALELLWDTLVFLQGSG